MATEQTGSPAEVAVPVTASAGRTEKASQQPYGSELVIILLCIEAPSGKKVRVEVFLYLCMLRNFKSCWRLLYLHFIIIALFKLVFGILLVSQTTPSDCILDGISMRSRFSIILLMFSSSVPFGMPWNMRSHLLSLWTWWKSMHQYTRLCMMYFCFERQTMNDYLELSEYSGLLQVLSCSLFFTYLIISFPRLPVNVYHNYNIYLYTLAVILFL